MKRLFEEIADVIPTKYIEWFESEMGWDEMTVINDYLEYCSDNNLNEYLVISFLEYFDYNY